MFYFQKNEYFKVEEYKNEFLGYISEEIAFNKLSILKSFKA